MSFDGCPLSVREAAALAAMHAHPPAPDERATLRLSWLRFYVYVIASRHRFTDWPAKERAR